MHIVTYTQVKEKTVSIRTQPVILDSDSDVLYGIETKNINKAVKNNPNKFPVGYTIKIVNQEKYHEQ
jgi:hypothetical protein